MRRMDPVKPTEVDLLAVDLLIGLEKFSAARHIVLGGYFALKHYCDYRATHDVGAWWSRDAGEAERQAVRVALQSVLAGVAHRRGLALNRRQFGDTEFWEFKQGGTKIFSFQIASRTLQLEAYLPSPWPPLQIEGLSDNVASKMNALVQRGAPRDFVDVRQLTMRGLATAIECWDLWQRKNPDLKLADAQAEAARHLQALELRRPLDSIAEPAEHRRAAETRDWFRTHFLPGS